jgi:ribose transport system permease protein
MRQDGAEAPTETGATGDVAPTSPEPLRARGSQAAGFLSRNSLFVIWLLLVLLFWRLLPGVFLSVNNIRSTATLYSVSALVALAITVPLVADQFDLSVGYLIGLVNIFTLALLTKHHVGWVIVIMLMLLLGAAVGLINGLIVTQFQISSFITTLGTGSILYAIGLWYSSGAQLTGVIPAGFSSISGYPLGIPLPAIYVVVVATLLFVALEYTPAGRQLYVLGSSPRTASLLGIRTSRYVVMAFVVSGLLVAGAGLVLASLIQSASSNTGPEYLLPAFAAVFLGSTSVRPGRVNVIGTVLAVVVLATVVDGLSLRGLQSWIQPMFNGVMLVGAVAISGYLLRRKEAGNKFRQMNARLGAIAEKISPNMKDNPPD